MKENKEIKLLEWKKVELYWKREINTDSQK